MFPPKRISPPQSFVFVSGGQALAERNTFSFFLGGDGHNLIVFKTTFEISFQGRAIVTLEVNFSSSLLMATPGWISRILLLLP